MAILPGDLSELIAPNSGQEDPASVEQADEEDSGTLGLDVRFMANDLVVTRVEPGLPADRAGIKPGSLIQKIRGKEISQFIPTLTKLDEPRRQFLAWRAVSRSLSGSPGSKVAIELLDAHSRRQTLKLERLRAPGEAIQFGSMPVIHTHFDSKEVKTPLNRRVGLIRFDLWMLPTALSFNKAM